MGRIMVQRRWHYDGYDVVDVSCGRLENRGWWRWCKKSWPRKLQSQLSGEEMEIPISPNCSIPRLVALWSIPFGLYGCFWYFLIYPAKVRIYDESMNPEMRQILVLLTFFHHGIADHRWSSLIIARSLALTSRCVALTGCLSTTGWTSALCTKRNGSKLVTGDMVFGGSQIKIRRYCTLSEMAKAYEVLTRLTCLLDRLGNGFRMVGGS